MKNAKRFLALLLASLLCITCFSGAATALSAREAYASAADEPVRVIVQMEGEPAAASAGTRAQTEIRLTVQHTALRRSLEASGIAWAEDYEYRTVFNGFALTVPRSGIDQLAALPGVKSVHLANRYSAPAPAAGSSNEMTGAAWMHESDYMGSGTVIAILDTGITADHEAFGVYDGMLEQAKLSEAEARSRIRTLGYGAWLSQKIPFAYDYSAQSFQVSDTASGRGTMVAGIAAGYARDEDGAVRFCGTAPDAQLLIMKLFGDDTQEADSAVCIKSLEDACLLGADVINLSLGSRCGDSWDAGTETEVFGEIYELLRENGVLVNTAAGDEGSMAEGASNHAGSGDLTSDYADYGLISAQAAYAGNLASASAENLVAPVHVLRANERDIRFCDRDGRFFASFYQADEPPVEYTVVPGWGEPEDYEGLMIEGRIALVARGEISFQEKLNAAAEAGAAGLLVYNNVPGELWMVLDDYRIPAASISLEDGEYLISLAETVTPPPEPGPVDDSEEDLGTVYYRINSQESCVDGAGYLIVCQSASLVFNSGASNVNAAGNGLPVTIRGGHFPSNDALRAAELRLEAGCFANDRGYLGCGGTANEVRFYDSPEDLDINITEEGTAAIVCRGCSFRYDQSGDVFRFYLPTSGLIGSEDAAVSLYRRGQAPTYYPTQIGVIFFPKDLAAAENPDAWQLSAFSSVGVTPDLELKPSITGVGGNVLSAEAGTETDYAWSSGTSLAASNVSGALACLLQYVQETRPELDRAARAELAEALLLSTARVLTDAEGRYVSPRKQGAGLIDLQAAAEARAVIREPVLSLKNSETGTYALHIEIRSLCAEDLSYNLDLTALCDLCEQLQDSDTRYNTLRSRNVSRDVFLEGNTSVEVPAGETVSVDLTLQVSEELLEELRSDFPNGGWLDGFVALSEPEAACTGGDSCPGSPFEDMPSPRNWAHAGIDFVLNHDLFSGTSATTFSPGMTMTRGMMVTVLYSLAGKPEPEGENPFTDVKPGKYYEKPVTWASENGIVSGIGEGLFDPGGDITREQMALIMYRFAQYAGLDTDIAAPIDGYPDVGRVHSYAVTAMRWAVGVGILSGNKVGDEVLLDPRSNATRAQVARLFMSFVQKCLEPPIKTSQIHLSFTAFVGDWTDAPILEQHDWREIAELQHWLETTMAEDCCTYAELGYTYLDFADFEVNTDVNKAWAVSQTGLPGEGETEVYLGENPLAQTEFQADHAAISPNGLLNAVRIEPMTLRNARHLIMTVTDAETHELYAADERTNLQKAYRTADGWQSAAVFDFDGRDRNGDPLPGGTRVEIGFYADLCWQNDVFGTIDCEDLYEQGWAWLVWSFELTVDDLAPTVQGLRWDPSNKHLSLTLADDQYLAAAELTPLPIISEDETVYFEPVWTETWSQAEPGESFTLEAFELAFGEYTLTVWDYAGNRTCVRISLDRNAGLKTIRFVCPAGCTPEGVDLWYASDQSYVTAPSLDGGPGTGEFCGWLLEELEGYWTQEALEDAALYDEILWPGTKAQIWGETTFYALLRDGDLYFTAGE